MTPEEQERPVPKGPTLSVEIVETPAAEVARPPLDEAKVKRMGAFFKYTKMYWGMNADGTRGEPTEQGGGTLEHMDQTVIDGVNIGEVYRELKANAVKRMQDEKIEDAPTADDLEDQWGGDW